MCLLGTNPCLLGTVSCLLGTKPCLLGTGRSSKPYCRKALQGSPYIPIYPIYLYFRKKSEKSVSFRYQPEHMGGVIRVPMGAY